MISKQLRSFYFDNVICIKFFNIYNPREVMTYLFLFLILIIIITIASHFMSIIDINGTITKINKDSSYITVNYTINNDDYTSNIDILDNIDNFYIDQNIKISLYNNNKRKIWLTKNYNYNLLGTMSGILVILLIFLFVDGSPFNFIPESFNSMLNSNVLNSNVLNSNVSSSNVLSSDVLSSNVLNSDVLSSNVLNSDVLSSNVLNSKISTNFNNLKILRTRS
jgi:hypothetical protein